MSVARKHLNYWASHFSGVSVPSKLYFHPRIRSPLGYPMSFNYEKLMRAKRAVDLVNSGTISIDQAIAVALASIGGTVFDVKVKEMNQQVVWRVKLMRSD